MGSAGWFDALDAANYFEGALSSGEPAKEQEVIGCFSFTPVLKQRSARIADLLNQYRTSDNRWNDYLQTICRSGEFYHDRRMFDLFLDLLRKRLIGVRQPNGTGGS